VDGYQIGLYVSAAVMTVGAVLALVALRTEPKEARAVVSVLEPIG
jgi:hypothetical protein